MKKEVYERMLQDQKELHERIMKLRNFLYKVAEQSLSSANIFLLEKQLQAMLEYERFLTIRIELNVPCDEKA